MSRVIILMRHAAYQQPDGVPSAHLPYPLTNAGLEQARLGALEVAQLAREHKWSLDPIIDCSTLLRAWQTAEIVADALREQSNDQVLVDSFDALAERSLGAVANLTVDEIGRIVEGDPRFAPLPEGWKRDSGFRLPFPGCESLIEAGQRVAKHLGSRLAEMRSVPDGVTAKIFVGHGGSIRHAALEMGALSESDVASLSMHYARPVCLIAASNDAWRHIAGDWKVRQPQAPQPSCTGATSQYETR